MEVGAIAREHAHQRSVEAAEALDAQQVVELEQATAADAGDGGKTVSLGLEKTKLKNAYSTMVQRRDDCVAEVTKEGDALLEELKASYGELDNELCVELVADVRAATAVAKDELESSFRAQMVALKDEMDIVASHGDCKTSLKKLQALNATLRTGKVNKFGILKGKTKKHLRGRTMKLKLERKGQDVVAAAVHNSPSNPMVAVMNNLTERGVTTSIFEAKAGISIAKVPVAVDLADQLAANAFVKKLVKSAKGRIVSSGFDWASSPMPPKDMKTTKIRTMLRKTLDANLLTKHVLPDEPWALPIFTPDFVAVAKGYFRFGANHFGGSEARVYLEGGETIVGIKYEAVAGENWSEKRRTLCCLTVDALQELAGSTSGFVLKANKEDVVLIPSGVVTLCSSEEGAVYSRWPVSGDQGDTLRAVMVIETLTREFPEIRMQSTGYTQLLEYLKDHVVG